MDIGICVVEDIIIPVEDGMLEPAMEAVVAVLMLFMSMAS